MLAGEEVFWFVGSIIASYMYQGMVSTVPTAPFYMAGASFAVATILFGWVLLSSASVFPRVSLVIWK